MDQTKPEDKVLLGRLKQSVLNALPINDTRHSHAHSSVLCLLLTIVLRINWHKLTIFKDKTRCDVTERTTQAAAFKVFFIQPLQDKTILRWMWIEFSH